MPLFPHLASFAGSRLGSALTKYAKSQLSKPRQSSPLSYSNAQKPTAPKPVAAPKPAGYAYQPSAGQKLLNIAINTPGATSKANSLGFKSTGTPIASLDSVGRAIKPTVAQTPASVNTAASPSGELPRTGADYSAATSGYSSYDPGVQARIAQMQQQAEQSSMAQRQPTQTLNAASMQQPTQQPKFINSIQDPSFLKKVAQDNLAKLQEKYLATLTPGEKERALQTQLTDYLGNARLGISNLEGQGRLIPLNLVRGQQSQLQEQANIGAQTLQGQLDNELANRTAQGQVYGTQLGFEQQRIQDEQQQADRAQNFQLQMLSAGYQQVDPTTVSDPNSVIQIGGQTFLKPSAESKVHEVGGNLVNERGEVIYEGPQSGGDGLMSVGQNSSIFNPATGEWYTPPISNSDAFAQQQQQQTQVSGLMEKIGLINSILGNSGINDAVGVGLFSRGPFSAGEQAKLSADVQRLISQDTIQTLLDLKSQGGTLGALSDQERLMLQSAASNLASWMIRDKDGNPTGKFRVKETDFLSEVNRLKSLTLLAVDKALTGGQYTQLANSGQITPEEYEELLMSGGSFTSAQSGALNSSEATRYGNLNDSQQRAPVMKTISTILGKGIITGYGSKFWKPGLDFVLPGGKNADVKWPTSFTVLSLDPSNKTGGFGNRARIRLPDGKEMWVSHLDKFNSLVAGKTYGAGTIIGKQGNTGKTYGRTGIHLDLTMPIAGKTKQYYTAAQVANYLRAA